MPGSLTDVLDNDLDQLDLPSCGDAFERNPAKEFTFRRFTDEPQSIWSDGTTMWVLELGDNKIYAFNMATKERDEAKDFDTLAAAGMEVRRPSGRTARPCGCRTSK